MTSSQQKGEQQAEKLVRELYRALSALKPSMGVLTSRAGVTRTYPSERARAGTMDLSKFCSLVDTTGEPLEDFIVRALGGAPRNPEIIKRPHTTEPAILARARTRALVPENEPATIPRAYLERLDDLRYDDPAKAKDRIESTIEDIESEDVPFALGVYASCCRPLLLFDEAWHSIATALEIARQLDQAWARANLLQRASILRYALNENELALATSECATLKYARLGDQYGVARTLVDQGPILWRLGRFHESVAAFRTALTILPENAVRNRWACHLALALIPFFRGHHREALEALEQARPLARSRAEQGKIQWLEACCLAELNRVEEALQGFDAGFALLASSVPTDAALLTCDRVRHLLRWERHQEAYDGARALRPLLAPLHERSETIAAAARELAIIESESLLNLKLVRTVKRRIEEASENQPAGLRQPQKS